MKKNAVFHAQINKKYHEYHIRNVNSETLNFFCIWTSITAHCFVNKKNNRVLTKWYEISSSYLRDILFIIIRIFSINIWKNELILVYWLNRFLAGFSKLRAIFCIYFCSTEDLFLQAEIFRRVWLEVSDLWGDLQISLLFNAKNILVINKGQVLRKVRC